MFRYYRNTAPSGKPVSILGATHWRCIDAQAAKTGLPSVIVAACELEKPDIEERLDAQQRIGRVRGVRQIVGRSDEEDRVTGNGWPTRLGAPACRCSPRAVCLSTCS